MLCGRRQAPRLSQKELLNIEPVVDAPEALDGNVVGRGEEDSFAQEPAQLAGIVVDQVIGADDALVPAIDDMRRRDKGKMSFQPAELLME